MEQHEIIRIPSVGQPGREQLRHQCYNVRIDVFHREQGFPLDIEIDEFCLFHSILAVKGFSAYFRSFSSLRRLDETAEHFLLRLLPSLRPIGTIRASRTSNTDYYKLNRLAVLNDYRKLHFGRELVLALHDWVATDALSRGETSAKVVAHSQIPAIAFYAKFGYTPEGDQLDVDGAPHRKMVVHLPTSR
ncbi:acyl-CoA N-acyltransferase [Lactarius hengduanensis]|nr:acyl-CoA N-acyltransferase [Lactarius hengduanensis]